jgi:hypothetical protein
MIVNIVLAKRKNPWMILSRVIMWAEEINYSHSAIIAHDEEGSFVYESVWPKCHKIPLLEWEKVYEVKIKKTYFINDEYLTKDDMKLWLNSQIGIGYSFYQLLMIGFGMLSAPIQKLIGQKTGLGSKYLICTELTGNFMAKFLGYSFGQNTAFLKLSSIHNSLENRK